MINSSESNRRGIHAIQLLLLIVIYALSAGLTWAGSIFDDDSSPPPAPPKSVEVPQPRTPSDADVPTPPQPSPSQNPPATEAPTATGVPETRLPEANAQRRSIPAKSAQSRSRRLFKDIYAKELADQSSQGRLTLARTLLQEAGKVANVPSDQFVLLLGAYEAGRDAASLGLCMEAADALADGYDVDALKLKADVAASLVPRANATANAENCREALPLLDELIAAEDYSTVANLATALRPMASSEPSLVLQLQNRGKEAEALRTGSETLAKELARLKSSPNDAAASLSAGQFLCFRKGNWVRGLPFLARGSDPKLKELATAELAKPAESKSIEQLGDRWWEFALAQHDWAREKVAHHAALLYSQALDSAAGIRRLMVEKKLGQAAAASGSHSRQVNLLALIDPVRDAIEGIWKLEHGELVANSLPGHVCRIRIPYQPPEEYDFRIDFTRARGNCILQMLSHQHHNFKWVLDLSGRTCGFDLINGRNCNDNEAHLDKPNSVRDGVRCTCVVQIRRGSMAAYVDGKLFERYQANYTQMSIEPMWDVGNDCLGIGGAENDVTFHRIELTEISGLGKRSPRVK